MYGDQATIDPGAISDRRSKTCEPLIILHQQGFQVDGKAPVLHQKIEGL